MGSALTEVHVGSALFAMHVATRPYCSGLSLLQVFILVANRGRLQAGRCFSYGPLAVGSSFTGCAFGNSTRSAVDVRYQERACAGLSDDRERRCYATLYYRVRAHHSDFRERDHFVFDRERDFGVRDHFVYDREHDAFAWKTNVYVVLTLILLVRVLPDERH